MPRAGPHTKFYRLLQIRNHFPTILIKVGSKNYVGSDLNSFHADKILVKLLLCAVIFVVMNVKSGAASILPQSTYIRKVKADKIFHLKLASIIINI